MNYIPEYESLTVEFKENWDEKKDGAQIKKTLVAFANTVGGDLYIGVNDEGQVVGLASPALIEEKLASTIRDSIQPSIAGIVSTERIKINGKVVLRVHVDAGNLRPYCLDPKTASGIYIRIGNTTSPASIDDIAKMVRENNPVPFEDRIAFEQNLTFEYCHKFCADRGLEFNPKSNLTFGFWNQKSLAYTNLAFICSDQSDVSEVLIRFAEDEKITILDSVRIEGSIFKLYDEATKFIAQSNYAWMEKPSTGSAERIDHYIIDPRVILEALVNAFAHRDYSKKPPNLIHITPSAVSMMSAGGLVEGLSVEDIALRMATECRNKKLAALFCNLHLMENKGSGFRRIRSFYKNRSIEDLLEVSKTSFTIMLPRPAENMYTGNERFKQVLGYLSLHQNVPRREVQSFLGLSQASTVLLLRDMVQANLIEQIGKGPSTRYKLKNL